MLPKLSATEARVIGSLIEKEMTTPEYYPLTLNALVNACNQKSNREPVMNLTEKQVQDAIEELKEKRLAWQMNLAGSRVPKYEHNLRSLFPLDEKEMAIIAVLMLRGEQTSGELRTRAERMASFSSTDEVEQTIKALNDREEGPFVAQIPRRAGQKENRFVELFSVASEPDQSDENLTEKQSSEPQQLSLSERVAQLEGEVDSLRSELGELKILFSDFRKQFE
ncbi:Protein of unknown function YceH [Chitinispirillum alkaliphilum]|nr:Protein of unknown function YceH [Chitinispirillum alkaliphilum]